MKKLICFIVVLAVVIAGITYFLKNTQKIFVISQELEPADVILILGGWNSKFRVEHGVNLYKRGFAPKIIVSDGYTICETAVADIMKEYTQKLGVPQENILVENQSGNTFENALFVKRILDANFFKKFILVTEDYHSGRSARTFLKMLGPGYTIISNPVMTHSQKEWEDWWKEESLRPFIFSEMFKYLYYLLFNEGVITSFNIF